MEKLRGCKLTVYHAFDQGSRSTRDAVSDDLVRRALSAIRALLGPFFTLAVMGICALAWMNSDNIVALGLSRDMVTEASISAVQTALKFIFVGVVATSLLFSHNLLRRFSIAIWRWEPAQALLGYLMAGFRLLATWTAGLALAAIKAIWRPVCWTGRKALATGALAYFAASDISPHR